MKINRRGFLQKSGLLPSVTGLGCALPTLAFAESAAKKRNKNNIIASRYKAVTDTSTGKVRGYARNEIFTFKGIPYGAPTDGENRFMPPQMPVSWKGVHDCIVYGPFCPQKANNGWLQQEYCFLYQWIDGYQDEDFLRLNVWTTALKWVHDNIDDFGGDKNNVIIFEQSGGTTKVITLMAMPSAKGLFHNAIAQSGSIVQVATHEYATQITSHVLANLKINPDSINQLHKIEYLKLLEVLSAAEKIMGSIVPFAFLKASHKAAQKTDPVYLYMFAWQTTMHEGRPRSFHCSEIPFAFANTDRAENYTGASEEASKLADKVAKCWINFASFGNPNHKGLPE